MTSEPHATPARRTDTPNSVEMPRPTVAPLVLAVGITLLAAGVPLGLAFVVVGAVVHRRRIELLDHAVSAGPGARP